MPISGTQPALTEARVGMMRVGGSRVGYVLPIPYITINGTVRTGNVRVDGVSIRDILNGTPNTATMRVFGFTPTEGHEVLFTYGTSPTEFRGRILSTNKIYELKPANVAWDCQCISEEWLLNRRKVTKRYLSQSATTIIHDIITTYTSGFSSSGVASGLPSLDEITFTNEDVTDCLDRICARIGEDWQLDYSKVLHVPAGDGLSANTITDTVDHGMSGIAVHTDLSQVKTRQSGEGGGSVATSDVSPGQTTIPVADSSWYSVSGGLVKAGPQVLTYTGLLAQEGQGSTVAGKTGLAPGALTAAVVANTAGNLGVGTFTYVVVFVINGGKTDAGTVSGGVTITHVTQPGTAGSAAGGTGGSMTTGDTYLYALTYITAVGETTAGGSTQITLTGGNTKVTLTSMDVSSDGRVTGRRLWRVNFSTGVWKLAATLNNVDTSYEDTASDASLTTLQWPSVNTSGSGQVSLTNIPLGPAGTTARELHRTEANGSTHKLAATITNNTATTHTDNVRDSNLGNEAPSISTVPVSPGDTTLRVKDLSKFAGTTGYVLVGGQVIRYAGGGGGAVEGELSGVPASGSGSITSIIPVGTTIVNAPTLTGIPSVGGGGVNYAINTGDEVNVWVTRNDTAAQTFMASAVGGDGIHEADPIQDRRMSEREITARCDAKLAELSTPLVTVRYITRDVTTQSGRDVTVTLGAPTNISGTFKIQSVTTTGFAPVALATNHGLADYRPVKQVECSSRRLTFEQILRVVKAGNGH